MVGQLRKGCRGFPLAGNRGHKTRAYLENDPRLYSDIAGEALELRLADPIDPVFLSHTHRELPLEIGIGSRRYKIAGGVFFPGPWQGKAGHRSAEREEDGEPTLGSTSRSHRWKSLHNWNSSIGPTPRHLHPRGAPILLVFFAKQRYRSGAFTAQGIEKTQGRAFGDVEIIRDTAPHIAVGKKSREKRKGRGLGKRRFSQGQGL